MSVIKRGLTDKKAQGVMEYLIVSSLIGILCLGVIKGFGGVLKKRIEHMQSEIVENLKIN